MSNSPEEPAAQPASAAPWWRRRWVMILAILVVLGGVIRVALPWAIARTVDRVRKKFGSKGILPGALIED